MDLNKVAGKLVHIKPLEQRLVQRAQAQATLLPGDRFVASALPAVGKDLTTPPADRIVSADLQVQLSGSQSNNQAQVNGTLQGRVTVSGSAIIKALRDHMPSSDGLRFEQFYFDPKAGEYLVEGHKIVSNRFKFVNPSFTIHFRPDGQGRLWAQASSPADYLAKAYNWVTGELPIHAKPLPTASDSLRDKLETSLDHNMFTTTQDGDKMILDLVPQLRIPMGSNLVLECQGFQGGRRSSFDADGNLVIELQQGAFTGRQSRLNEAQSTVIEPNLGDLRIQVAISQRAGGELQAESVASGQLQAHLDGRHAQAVAQKLSPAVAGVVREADLGLSNMTLHSHYGKGQPFTNQVEGDLSLRVNNGDIRLAGHLRANEDDLEHWQMEAENLVAGSSVAPPSPPTTVAIDRAPAALHVNVTEPAPPPFTPKLTPNRLDLVIDGPNYVAALQNSIRSARESVTIESFGFDNNTQPQSIMRELLERAAGLSEASGQLRPDGSSGVKVKILADKDHWYPGLWPEEVARYLQHCREPGWADKTFADLDAGSGPFAGLNKDQIYWYRTTYTWAKSFADELQEGKGEFAGLSPAQRQQALAAIARNLDVRQSGRYPVKTDHRKLAIIDGREGYTGGMNIADWNLVKAHDVMVNLRGPAVREMQEQFVRAWDESGAAMPAEQRKQLLKSAAALAAEAGPAGKAHAAVLITDSNRNDIEQTLLKEIDEARSTINVEEVFFAYPAVTERLTAAVRRGVSVNVVIPVPEETVGDLDGSNPFLFANLDAALQLRAAAKEVGAGKVSISFYPHTMHTKAMTFDGRKLVVGSANLDQRGMHGTLPNFLFNRELSLLIDDKDFTADFDRRIIGDDRRQAKSFDAVLQQMYDKYGGPAGLAKELASHRGKELFY